MQFQIAADSAVRKDQVPERSAAGAKSCFAEFTTPRQDSRDAEKVLDEGAAPGAPDSRTATGWTNYLGGLDLRSPCKGWALKLAIGKRQTLCGARYNKNPKE
ncbi:MAG: hypothetical protein DMG36_22055 [Acidobacteria bacterium]|nr:MAG: hypothetical protein DMG36_22055 [Acidobacteriota bacterium]